MNKKQVYQHFIDGDFRYRAEIDGLRALAVLGVIFFHAGFGLPGGYVGVDVFFVICGYLITSLIVRESQGGNFNLINFWERRIRRIIPTLAAVLTATLIAGWFVMLPADYNNLFKSASYLSVFASNIYYWQVNIGGYFAGDTEEMPLLHTWSLAVEEQFYLIAPILLIFFFRIKVFRTSQILLLYVGLGILTSLVFSQYLLSKHPVAAFYFLPSRAWELLLGTGLALIPNSATIWPPAFREFFAWLGIGLIVASFFLYGADTPFPGLTSLVPCLGSALFIWANTREHATPLIHCPTVLGRLFAVRPMVILGLISYSLYLWHWPFLAFAKYYHGETPPVVVRAILIALSLCAALFSYYIIETPFRKKLYCSNRNKLFKFAVAGLAIFLSISFAGYAFNGFPRRFPEAWQNALAENVSTDFLFVKNVTTDQLAIGDLPVVGVNDLSKPISILVWGDSHAMAALPAFDLMLRQEGWSGRYATYSSTAPLLNFYKLTKYGLNQSALLFNEEVLKYVEKNRIPHVFLVAAWGSYRDGGVTTLESLALCSEEPQQFVTSPTPYELALLATINKLRASGTVPWIVTQVPQQSHNVSKILRIHRNSTPNLNQPDFCNKPNGWDGLSGSNPDLPNILKMLGAKIIDPRPKFLNPSGDLYQIEKDGVILYRDDNHLTRRGAEQTITPLLYEYFIPSRI